MTVERRAGGMTAGPGTEFHYHVPVPYWLEKAQPDRLQCSVEMASLDAVKVVMNGAARDAAAADKAAGVTLAAPLRAVPEINIQVTAPRGVQIQGAWGGGSGFDEVVVLHTARLVGRRKLARPSPTMTSRCRPCAFT